MRKIYVSVVAVFGLIAVLPAQAQNDGVNTDRQTINHQFLGKRAYQQPVQVANSAGADQAWVGASLVVGQDQRISQQQLLRINTLGKRAL
jgi:hypothetical protein